MRLEETQTNLAEKNKDITDLKATVASSKIEVANRDAEVIRAKSVSDQRKDELNILQGQLTAKDAELSRYRADLAARLVELDNAKAALADTTAELSQARKEITDISGELDGAIQKITALSEVPPPPPPLKPELLATANIAQETVPPAPALASSPLSQSGAGRHGGPMVGYSARAVRLSPSRDVMVLFLSRSKSCCHRKCWLNCVHRNAKRLC